MTLSQWYMSKANEQAQDAEMLRAQLRPQKLSFMAQHINQENREDMRQAQDDCAIYVTLANQALARYGA